jgi:hypothetical protein
MVFVIFAVLVWKFVDFLRLLSNYNDNRSGVSTQLIAWISGIILVVLSAHTGLTGKLVLPGVRQSLNTIDFTSQIFLGLLVGSFASALVDFKQAFDRKDTAIKPSLNIDRDISNEEDASMIYEVEPADTTIYVGSERLSNPE